MFTAANCFGVPVGGVDFADYGRRDDSGFEAVMFCASWALGRVRLIYMHGVR
jgi:hypothetical protein